MTGLALLVHDLAALGSRPSLPDGPCELWIIVADAGGQVMGAAPVTGQLTWTWHAGRLSLRYPDTRVVVENAGVPAQAVLTAARPELRTLAPQWRVTLDAPPYRLGPGDTVTVSDGLIAIRPDPE